MIEQIEGQPDTNLPTTGTTIQTGFISIIIPTYNEADNIEPLVGRIDAAMSGRSYEILFVDDNSKDGTAQNITSLAAKYPVRVLVRRNKRGLATAILDGLAYTRGEIICVMDADLQHPPEVLPALFKEIDAGHDLVVASRYIPGGGCEGWSLIRRIMSKGAIAIAHLFLPLTRSSSDPMSGFFVFQRRVVAGASLNPLGYKILLEIEMMGNYRNLAEVPFIFVARTRGESKLSTRTQKEYLKHVFSLMHRKGEDIRFLKFLLVGGIGIIVNLAAQFILKDLVNMALSIAAALAIEISILTNFLLNDSFTFRDRQAGSNKFLVRLLKYNGICLIGAVVQYAVTLFLADTLGLYHLLAKFAGIIVATLIDYLVNNRWTWK
jgi:dolichol-phosphate mannosyltransferase